MYSKAEQLKNNKVKKGGMFGKKKYAWNNSGKKSKGLVKKTKKVKEFTGDLLDRSITVRLSPSEVRKRVEWILEKYQTCQICGSGDLDYPHHALDGVSRKDDRTMISICVPCHRHIHSKGFDGLLKTREEVEALGWADNEEYLKDINVI